MIMSVVIGRSGLEWQVDVLSGCLVRGMWWNSIDTGFGPTEYAEVSMVSNPREIHPT